MHGTRCSNGVVMPILHVTAITKSQHQPDAVRFSQSGHSHGRYAKRTIQNDGPNLAPNPSLPWSTSSLKSPPPAYLRKQAVNHVCFEGGPCGPQPSPRHTFEVPNVTEIILVFETMSTWLAKEWFSSMTPVSQRTSRATDHDNLTFPQATVMNRNRPTCSVRSTMKPRMTSVCQVGGTSRAD